MTKSNCIVVDTAKALRPASSAPRSRMLRTFKLDYVGVIQYIKWKCVCATAMCVGADAACFMYVENVLCACVGVYVFAERTAYTYIQINFVYINSTPMYMAFM